jgi:conjugative transfer pilus assembly protein TraH
MKSKLLFARLVCSVALALPIASHAGGIMGDLTQMFMSNSTSSGVISTPDRTGIFGGSIIARSPVQSINWVSFDPPRFDAGCGGIDLYGGSFSFINSSQLVTIFRQVASNAAGLAFKAAIKAISPTLDQLISDFQSLMQNLNNLSKNSCQMAHAIVDPLDNAIQNSVNGSGNIAAVNKGLFGDTFAALDSYVSNANAAILSYAKNNSKAGNGILKALTGTKAGDIMGMATVPNIDGSPEDASDPNSLNNRILVSMLGYEIAAIPCQQSNESGSANSTSGDPQDIGNISCKGPSTIDLEDLIKGGGAGSANPQVPLKLYYCVNPSGAIPAGTSSDPQICTQMQRRDYNYVGVRGWVNNMLFGNPIGDATAITNTSIVGAFNAGGSAALTPAQIKFVQTARIPLFALFARSPTPEGRTVIAEKLSEHVVDCMGARIGEALYKSASYLKGSETGYTLSKDILDRIDTVRSDYMAKMETCRKDLTVLHLVELANAATRLSASSNR